MRRTIFITSFHPLISRNIIRTEVISKLISNACRVVVLVPKSKLDYFKKEFERGEVLVEGVETGAAIRTLRVGIMKRLAEALPNTKRAALGRRLTLSGNKKNALYYYFFYLPAGFLGKSKLFMKLARFFDYFISPRGRFYPLFEKYKPDLIFSTDVQNEYDVCLVQDAHKKGIVVIGMVRSWDNLVTRAFRFVPDKLMVHNDIIKEQAVSIYGLKPDKIIVTGVPHYDKYVKAPFVSREEFFRRVGLDQTKKTVLFFPLCDYRIVRKGGETPTYTDKDALEALSKISANVIVRFPPNETVTIPDFVKPVNFFYDQPGVSFGQGASITTRELNTDDDIRLANELYYSDVVVSGPSTAVIDAAVFDKPIIFLDFGRDGADSLVGRIFEYESEHIVNILKTGGARVATAENSLKKEIGLYLENPKRDSIGRTRIVKEQCFLTDGKASERVTAAILENIK
ncbi:MAG: CDP-glycerol glycerophosphotransferase family protein [Patescibacteria group bacterium]